MQVALVFFKSIKNYPMYGLIYGKEYRCYWKNEDLGIATYTNDEMIGDCFLRLEVNKKGRLEEIFIMPDRWILFCRPS